MGFSVLGTDLTLCGGTNGVNSATSLIRSICGNRSVDLWRIAERSSLSLSGMTFSNISPTWSHVTYLELMSQLQCLSASSLANSKHVCSQLSGIRLCLASLAGKYCARSTSSRMVLCSQLRWCGSCVGTVSNSSLGKLPVLAAYFDIGQ